MGEIIRIAIDVMGGDFGPHVTIPASFQIASANSNIELILVGDTAKIEPFLNYSKEDFSKRVKVCHASQTIAMDEKPSAALRGKKDSSIHVAMSLVRDSKADAVVSAGNSGALMAVGKHTLKMLPRIDRPAMCAKIPDNQNYCYLLDLGANINSSAKNLYQYAVMGSVFAATVAKKENPTVGLLNIGAEEIKGDEQLKTVAGMLTDNPNINFIGFVEADKIFEHAADVVVCDGFVGNVVLKASEGVAKLIKEKIVEAFASNWYRRLAALIATPIINDIRLSIDPGRMNGASLLGLQGNVVKSHGNADVDGFAQAIGIAFEQARIDVPKLISNELAILDY